MIVSNIKYQLHVFDNKIIMNVLFIVSSMGGGGAQRVAALLCNAWTKRGHQVTLMPTFSRKGECAYDLEPGVNLEFLADYVGGKWGRLRRLWALHRYIRRTRPDVIISFLGHVNVAALLAAIGTKVPVIVSERIYPPLNDSEKLATRLLRWLIYRWSERVVVQTVTVQRWIEENCPGSKGVVIPNPVSFPMTVVEPVVKPPEVIEEGRRVILAVGRLDPQKRFDVLVATFARLAPLYPEWDLVIVGEGPELFSLKAEIETANLGGRIHLPGFLGNVGDWYTRAELYVLPSAYEGFPNTLIEAMSYGLPCIAFDVPTGPAEIMDGGRLGVLLPDVDHVSALEKTMVNLLRDDTRRDELSRRAVSVQSKYAMKPVLRQWDQLFERQQIDNTVSG